MGSKGKLFGLLVIFAAIGMVTASGAFTSVTATRTATVDVTGDSSALLKLEPANTPNGDEYARENAGELEIDLSGYNSSATGVNANATLNFTSVFVITNQGTQEVNVSITDAGDNPNAVVFYNTTFAPRDSSGATGGLETTEVTLATGESVTVSIYVDTSGLSSSDNLVNSITINATAT
jgi:hypothetical protein